jgi:hypothetical protein
MISIIIILLLGLLLFSLKQEHFSIKPSIIQGVGLFAYQNYKPNTRLFKAIDNNQKVTYLGSKINHCDKPNTYLLWEPNGWFVYSNRNIKKDEELIIDYNHTPNFIKKPNAEWKC